MLTRNQSPLGPVYYTAPLLSALNVPHGFSTRIGGVSPPPFDSLNMGNPQGVEVQDDYDRIWRNYDLLAESIDAAGRSLVRVHQVHGNQVVLVRRGDDFDSSARADAIVSDDPARLLSVRVADCVPILLAAEWGRIVAAVHAGWRGVVAGVLPAAIDAMERLADRSIRETLAVAIGPCLSRANFEVGPEVLDAFEGVFRDRAPVQRRDDGKGHVDLVEAVRLQLDRADIPPENVAAADLCTWDRPDEFFSHRRDKGRTGRMAAVIAAIG